MSKLSEAVKALINAGHAKPGYTRASAQTKPALERFASDAHEKKVGLPAWVTVSVRATQPRSPSHRVTSPHSLALACPLTLSCPVNG